MNEEKSKEEKPAWYALRRSIAPWRFEENLKELADLLPEQGIDELILFLMHFDEEKYTVGQPHIEWVKQFQPSLFRIKDVLEQNGIRYSINPLVVLGHADYAGSLEDHLLGVQKMVGSDGATCRTVPCPLSSVWEENMLAVWRLYAETKPHVLWVEDDTRMWNHFPVQYGCFCPLHLEKFAQLSGESVTREELAAAVFKLGKPHPWRKIFMSMQSKTISDFAGKLGKAVREVSPETHLGLMSAGPRAHCLEGRDWKELCSNLAADRSLYIRPSLGSYSEQSLRGLYYTQDSVKLSRYVAGEETIDQTEIENYPMTRYSKSALFTFLQAAISFAYGSKGITLNIYDHMGIPMADDMSYGVLLKKYKPFLASLAERVQQKGAYRGVQVLHHDESGYYKQITKPHYLELREDGQGMVETLETLGIATTYEEAPVMMLCGQILRSFSNEEIKAMLKKNLFIDAVCAGVLVERGFLEEIGLKSYQPPKDITELNNFKYETFTNEKFGGGKDVYMRCTSLGRVPQVSEIEVDDNAEVISQLVSWDKKDREFPFMYAYENKYGGRIIVQAADLTEPSLAYLNNQRQPQFQYAFRWLSHDKSALMVDGDGVYPLGFRRDTDAYSVMGMFNLSLDSWNKTVFEFESVKRISRIEVLLESGVWEIATDSFSAQEKEGVYSLTYEKEIRHGIPLIFTVFWG